MASLEDAETPEQGCVATVAQSVHTVLYIRWVCASDDKGLQLACHCISHSSIMGARRTDGTMLRPGREG